jgi:FkbM family methyltransferase
MGLGDRLARQIRDRSGPGTARIARPLHTLSAFGLGHGAAELPVTQSGERHPLALVCGKNPIVFDVGAFRGDYALLAREVLGPGAVIHCFEPNPASFAQLERHDDLHVHRVALAGEAGQRTLFEHPDAPTIASLHADSFREAGREPSSETTVDAATLDSFCAGDGIDRIDMLKIDVEGAEVEVLQGARSLLDRRAVGIVQFEFGYGNVASRTFMRDFYEMLGGTHDLHRVAPHGLVRLGDYRLELEVFVSATNYVAVPGQV